jgi:hypothetical protein
MSNANGHGFTVGQAVKHAAGGALANTTVVRTTKTQVFTADHYRFTVRACGVCVYKAPFSTAAAVVLEAA